MTYERQCRKPLVHSIASNTSRLQQLLVLRSSLWIFKKKGDCLQSKASSAFHGFRACESSILVKLEFEDVGFCGGRKTIVPRDKPLNQNQQQTQSNSNTDLTGM